MQTHYINNSFAFHPKIRKFRLFNMDVSIIIVSYNTKKLIENCIQSIYDKTTGIDFEIIVVDNASRDGSQEIIKTKFKNIKLIELNENIGFGCANNEGIKVALGKNIFFLNPDTILLNNSIKILSEFLDQNSGIGACGGNLYTKDLKPNFSFMPFFPTLLPELNLLSGNLIYTFFVGKNYQFNYTGKPFKVAYITGADMMITRKCLSVTGLFDTDFFMYYEETELSLRIKKSGYKIYSVPDAKIIHFEGGSFSYSEDSQRFSLVSRSIFMKKAKKGYIYRFLSDSIYFTICLVGMLRAKVKNNSENYNFWLFSFKEFRKITSSNFSSLHRA